MFISILHIRQILGICTVADRNDFGDLNGAPWRSTRRWRKKTWNLTKSNGNSIVIRHCIYTTVTISAFYVYTIVSRSFIAFRDFLARGEKHSQETIARNSISLLILFFFSFYIACALCSVSRLNNNSRLFVYLWLHYTVYGFVVFGKSPKSQRRWEMCLFFFFSPPVIDRSRNEG